MLRSLQLQYSIIAGRTGFWIIRLPDIRYNLTGSNVLNMPYLDGRGRNLRTNKKGVITFFRFIFSFELNFFLEWNIINL